jgi:hypothetical protein
MPDDGGQWLPVFMPPLRLVLLKREQLKGSLLAEQQVNEICNSAICMAMTPSQKLDMDESRGYQDIDPNNIWVELQSFRSNQK